MTALSASQMASALSNAGFTNQDIAIGVAIGLAESGGDPSATNHNTNGSTDFGVWQINSVHADILAQGNWADVNDNAKMAHAVWQSAGGSWKPWATFTQGSYLRFLSEGQSGASNPQAIGTVADTSVNPFQNIVDFFQVLSNPETWVRIGEVIAGAILIFIALRKLNGRTGMSHGIKKVLL